MTHYSDNVDSVRVDIFKPSGKWYTTLAVQWLNYNYVDIFEAFKKSLENDDLGKRYLSPYDEKTGSRWVVVCLHPYHEHAHPIILGLGYGD